MSQQKRYFVCATQGGKGMQQKSPGASSYSVQFQTEQNHRIIQSFRLEKTVQDYQAQPLIDLQYVVHTNGV